MGQDDDNAFEEIEDGTKFEVKSDKEVVYDLSESEEMEITSFSTVKKTGTLPSSMANLSNTILGAGMLGIPGALVTTGLLFGVFLVGLSASLSFFGLHLLAEASIELKKRGYDKVTFSNVAQESFPKLKLLINLAIAIKCYGVSISYLVVIGDLMPEAISFIFNVQEGIFVDRRFYISLLMLIIIPLAFLPRINDLRFTSWVALFTVAYLTIMIVGYYFVTDWSDVKEPFYYWHLDLKFFQVMPIFVFAFTCHQNLFAIFTELQDNTFARINAVIGVSIFSCLVVYEIVSITGYSTYGAACSGNILLDYPQDVVSTIGRLAVTVLVTFSYPLQSFPFRNNSMEIVEAIAKATTKKEVNKTPFYIGITLFICITTYIIAVFVTSLDLVLSLVGATGSTIICYILPGFFYFQLTSSHGITLRRVLALLLGIFGVCFMCVAVTVILLDQFDPTILG